MTARRSLLRPSSPADAVAVIQEQIQAGTDAKKCHVCGCFQQTVTALAATEPGRTELGPALAKAREVFGPRKYDCLGCPVCFPAVATNAFADAFPELGGVTTFCSTEVPVEREGWPPLPGDYKVLRYGAAVAVCTLNSPQLVSVLLEAAPDGLAIVGTMSTENLGIERLILNVISNPNIRYVILCGEDTQQAVGHLPGQALQSLVANGMGENGSIIGAKGRSPVLKNVDREAIDIFRRQVELRSLIGELEGEKIVAEVRQCDAKTSGPFDGSPVRRNVTRVQAPEPVRLVPDPAGYFVVYPDRRSGHLLVEHFSNDGVFTCAIEGESPAAVYAATVERDLLSRLDHAAYLGRELARAERALTTGEPYVQDRAAGEIVKQCETAPACCGSSCCGDEPKNPGRTALQRE